MPETRVARNHHRTRAWFWRCTQSEAWLGEQHHSGEAVVSIFIERGAPCTAPYPRCLDHSRVSDTLQDESISQIFSEQASHAGTLPLPYLELKMLFRAQGKLHHPFEQLVRRQASEIVHDQLLGVEPHEVAKLQ
jgi:hypothetical protein